MPESAALPTPAGLEPYATGAGWAVYCADCRDVLPALADQTVDMVLTDPPYGHNNNNNGDLIHRIEQAIPKRRRKGDDGSQAYEARPIANDGAEADPLFCYMIEQTARLLRHAGCCCCCGGGGGPDPLFARWALWMDGLLRFKQAVVWDKGPMGMGWHYRRSYELMLVAERRGSGPSRWYADSHKVENILRAPGCPNSPGIRKIIPRREQHPTEKPPELGRFFLRLHTQPGDVVLDPMMGSGAFGEAAVSLGRRFIGVELDPHWCAIAAERLRAAELETGT